MTGSGNEWRVCPACGYDVTNLPLPGLCPECGDPLTHARPTPDIIQTIIDVTFRPWRLRDDTFSRPPRHGLWITNAIIASVLASLLTITPYTLALFAWPQRIDPAAWMLLLLFVATMAPLTAIIPLNMLIVEAIITAATGSGSRPRRIREACQAHAAAIWPGALTGLLLATALAQGICILLEKTGATTRAVVIPGLLLLPAALLFASIWHAIWLAVILRCVAPRAARHIRTTDLRTAP